VSQSCHFRKLAMTLADGWHLGLAFRGPFSCCDDFRVSVIPKDTTVLAPRMRWLTGRIVKTSLQDITIQCYVLILLDLIYIFIRVSKTIFVSVYTPLVAILFNASVQLVSNDLTMAVVERRKRRRKGKMFTHTRTHTQRERAIAASKTSVAGRLKYDIHLSGSSRDCEL
jgi:hypothetical protein